MGYIVAIGGGDNGWGDSIYETKKADNEIVALSAKKHPVLLFIGFAARVPEEYYKTICNIYSQYGCKFEHLDIEACKEGRAEALIWSADIIYVGGGNTVKLMRSIRKYNLDSLLLQAYYSKDVVLCGVSAGAICWCRYGNSAVRHNKNGECTPIRVRGIGILDVLYCPHCSRDHFRNESTKIMLKRTPGYIGLEIDYAAIIVVKNQFCVLPLDERSVARKTYWYRGGYYSHDLPEQKNLSINLLFSLDEKEADE